MGPKTYLKAISGLFMAGALLSGCGDDDRSYLVNPTPTPVPGTGPVVTFFGVTRADDFLIEPTTMEGGVPVYVRPNGAGFSLVVEARRGSSGSTVGTSAFNEDLGGFPDLQIQVSRNLGNGSSRVCDDPLDNPGGVPATNPADFSETRRTIQSVNDFACRFVDGGGAPLGRTNSNDSCVTFSTGDFAFVDPTTEVQFCGPITVPLAFKSGDTLVTARVRDNDGNTGPERKLIIRVDD